jgi:hypothetical protein
MDSGPKEIKELVERFERNLDSYKRQGKKINDEPQRAPFFAEAATQGRRRDTKNL